MRRSSRRPGDSDFRGVGLEVAGGDERDVKDLPPLLGRDGSCPSSIVSEPLIRASMTRHRQGRICSVTLWRNSTRVTVYHSARGRERTNGDSTMTSVAQDRRGGGTCTRIRDYGGHYGSWIKGELTERRQQTGSASGVARCL